MGSSSHHDLFTNWEKLPLFAAYQLSVSAALAWGGAGAALIVAVHASGGIVHLTPEFNPSGWQLALDRIVMLAVVAAFAIHARLVSEQRLQVIRTQTNHLKLARDEAIKASEIKSAFLATMSHEIRTPLHGVLGLAEILSHSALVESDQATVQAIQASGRLLLTIVNDILDLSRLEKGQLHLESIPFQLDQVLGNLIDLNLPGARKKNLGLWLRIEPGVPNLLQGDPTRLQQILMNLVSNALKFTAQGEVVISARPIQGQIRLEVKDSGEGIAAADMDRLFQPFEQLDSSITRRFGGSGLGLAISQALAQSMGSQIQVESQPGVGSRFYLNLPNPSECTAGEAPLAGKRVRLQGLQAEAERSTASVLERAGARLVHQDEPCDWFLSACEGQPVPEGARAIWLGEQDMPIGFQQRLRLPLTHRILLNPSSCAQPVKTRSRSQQALVVEDNSVNQKVMLGMLKRLGWEAEVAGNGLEALERLARQEYPLVLMDLQMPVLDGLETTRRIRQQSGTQPYIIVVTANAFPEVKETVRQAGADDILTKPLHLEELAASLERLPQV